MRGRKLIDILCAVALLLCLQASSIAHAGAEGRPVAAILLSDSEDAYIQAATAFDDTSTFTVRLFDLQGDIEADPGLKGRLFATRPALIFALGAKAAYAAKLWTLDRQEIPVIFAMVLNWQRYNLLEGSANITGIGAETAPGTQFVNMTMFSPLVRRIGVVHGPHSIQLLAQAREAAALLSLELVSESISRSDHFQRAYKKIAGQVDAFWILNDPVLYTLENIDWLEGRCLKDKILCVGQSANIARLGVTLSVNADISQIGAQAAAMAKNIVENGQSPGALGVMDPLATQVLLNLKTADKIGLPLSAQTLDLATMVIR